MSDQALLVVSAHVGDFVWRAGGAIALHSARGHPVTVVCLAYGERGESARLWRQGLSLEQVKEARHAEAEAACKVLGADLIAFDADDYPLVETPELRDRLERGPRQVRAREGSVAQLEARLAEARDRAKQTQISVDRKNLPDLIVTKLSAGMPAEVVIPTGERTVFAYLIAPLTERFGASMRER